MTPNPYGWRTLGDAARAFEAATLAARALFREAGADAFDDPELEGYHAVEAAFHDAMRRAGCCVHLAGRVYVPDTTGLVTILHPKPADEVEIEEEDPCP